VDGLCSRGHNTLFTASVGVSDFRGTFDVTVLRLYTDPLAIRQRCLGRVTCSVWVDYVCGRGLSLLSAPVAVTERSDCSPAVGWSVRDAFLNANANDKGSTPMTTVYTIDTCSWTNSNKIDVTTSDDLCVPAVRLPTVGRRAFSVAGARVWDALPADPTSLQHLLCSLSENV